MTHKEFFTKVISISADQEMVDFANAELAKIVAKNAKANDKRKENAKANEPIMAEITNYLSQHKCGLANELAQVCGVSTSKASAMCSKLVDMGIISKREVSIPKVGKRMAYSLIQAEKEETSTDTE